MLVVMSVCAWRVTSPALPRLENDWMGWVASMKLPSLTISMLPPSAACSVLLALEVTMPVMALPMVVMLMFPALPDPVLLAEMVLSGAIKFPVFMTMLPPEPAPRAGRPRGS